MKIFLLAIFVLPSIYSTAQRFLPVIEEGRNIDWSSQGPDGLIYDMDVYEDQLILVGNFIEVNELSAERVCAWDGNQFSNFGEELSELNNTSRILNICSTPDGVYITGNMNQYNNILFGTGGSWSPLGDGLDSHGYDMIWFEDRLIVCGRFENSGEIPLSYVAAWNGESWSPMGSGMNDDVLDLIIYQDELYACGYFTEADSQTANHIAKWNGDGWEAVGNGFDDDAYCMIEFEEQLVIGGRFLNSGDGLTSYPKVAVFDGESFQNTYSHPEAENIHFMSILNNQLTIISSATWNPLPGAGFILNNNLFERLPDFEPQIKHTQEFLDNTFTINLNFSNATSDEKFYQNNSLLLNSMDGKLQYWLQNEELSGSVFPSATIFSSRQGNTGLRSSFDDSGLGTVFGAAPWISAKTSDNQLFGNYQKYYNFQSNSPKFYFGPKSDSYDQDYVDRYMQVWALTSDEISIHLANYDDAEYEMPYAISSWPGNGRTEHGEQSHLAPFIDTNENGFYEPHLGDYPLVKGDQCAYYLICDSHDPLVEGQPSGLEIGVMLYSFNIDNPEIASTIFVNYHMRNASGMDYPELKFGMWTDAEIGNPTDDFVGCSPEDNMYFFYNGDPIDEPYVNRPGYADSIPAQGIMFLNHSMGNFMNYNNGFGGNGAASTPVEHNNMLNSYWVNGQPLLFGGDGFDPGTGADPEQPVDFIYDTDPNLTSGEGVWNEIAVGNLPGDRAGIGSMSPISLGIDEIVCIDLAFITAFPDQAGQNPALAVTKLKERAAAVSAFYQTLEFACEAQTFPLKLSEEEVRNHIKLYPNPASSQVRIESQSNQIERVNFYDMSGRLVLQKTNLNSGENISIEKLDPGIYLINAQVKGKSAYQTKMVKL